jgi:hypothetical protein
LLQSCQIAAYMKVSMSWPDMAFCFMLGASHHHKDDDIILQMWQNFGIFLRKIVTDNAKSLVFEKNSISWHGCLCIYENRLNGRRILLIKAKNQTFRPSDKIRPDPCLSPMRCVHLNHTIASRLLYFWLSSSRSVLLQFLTYGWIYPPGVKTLC